MRIVCAVLIAACVHHTTSGPLVADLRMTAAGVSVSSCYMENETSNATWLLLLPPIWLLCYTACLDLLDTKVKSTIGACSESSSSFGEASP